MSEDSHFRLRIPLDLKAKIEEAAKASGRSINAQVLFSIEMALGQGDQLEEHQNAIDDHEERLKQIERDISRLLDAAGLYE